MAQGATRETVEWLKCAADPAYFVDQYCIIDEPQGATVSLIPFRLWPEQISFLWTLLTEKRVITLKARQLGISWLCCAYALWLCLFQSGRVVLAFSQGQSEADELIRRVKAMYDRLPDTLRGHLPYITTENISEIGWSNGSRMESFPATKKAGRSFTASLVLMDEIAFMEWAEPLYVAVTPTVDNGGQLVAFSTANGEDNLHHRLFTEAQKGINGFKAIFLPWWVHPKRDNAWYARTEGNMPSSASMRQEYPATPEEAFAVSGNERFLPDMLYWDSCLGVLPGMDARHPLILAADAGVSNDNFGLVGVSRHPARPLDVVVRYVKKWVPPRDGKIDFDEPEKEIRRLAKDFNVSMLTFDPYQLHDMTTRLRNQRIVPVVEFPQGADRYESDKNLLDLILRRGITHDGNTELREHLSNADREVDSHERKLRIVKRVASKKIDLAVALSMATYRCLRPFVPDDKPKPKVKRSISI